MPYSGTFLHWLFNPYAYTQTTQGESKHKAWAKKAYRLHNYTCRRCGYSPRGKGYRKSKRQTIFKTPKDKTLTKEEIEKLKYEFLRMKVDAHHVKPKRFYPRDAYKLDNAELLCEDCHWYANDSLHNSMKLKDCNPKTFNKWLRATKKSKK